ncbi:tudor domain-containing protein 3, partial [Tachysurus ichikawai]
FLTDEGIDECNSSSEKEKAVISDILNVALNTDLRSIGKGFLPADINSGRVEEVKGPCVLQVLKVRNVAAPKEHEESQAAPRMLRLQMTDGQTTCAGLEFKHLSKIRHVICVAMEMTLTNVKQAQSESIKDLSLRVLRSNRC